MGEHTTTHRLYSGTDRAITYTGMIGRISLAEIRAFLDEHAPGISDDDIMFNYATVCWERQATPEELADRAHRQQRQLERTEAWERKTLKSLKEKYE